MEESRNLKLPYIMPSQAQKHITHNEALRMLDAVTHLSVRDRDLSSPPSEPADGVRYLVAEGSAGQWQGHEGHIAAFQDGAWQFFAPQEGWLCFVADEAALVAFDGTAWLPLEGASPFLQNIERLGLATEADEANPFAARLNSALWTASYAGEGGNGDLRYMMNKEGEGNTLSLLMQSDWSGRAEIGLAGNDDLTIKVSDDGANWTDALRVDRQTGRASFPQGIVDASTGFSVPLYVPAPVASIYRCDALRGATPRTVTIGGAAGQTITLASAVAGPNGQWGRWNQTMGSFVRVWNMSKSPPQSAWLMDSPDATTLTVTDAAHIAGWTSGETLRMGDPNPTGDNGLQMVALDISPYLQENFGQVFPQKGLLLGLYTASNDGPAGLDFSGTGAVGTAMGGNALSNGARNQTSLPIPTPVPSPISNSNLIFFREQMSGGSSDITVAFARVLGVYV